MSAPSEPGPEPTPSEGHQPTSPDPWSAPSGSPASDSPSDASPAVSAPPATGGLPATDPVAPHTGPQPTSGFHLPGGPQPTDGFQTPGDPPTGGFQIPGGAHPTGPQPTGPHPVPAGPVPGYPQPPAGKSNRTLFIVLGATFGALLLIGACCVAGFLVLRSRDDASDRRPARPGAADTRTPFSWPTPSASPSPVTVGLNTPVRDGVFEFTVTKVQCGVPEVRSGVLDQQAKGQFCLVDMSVKNIGQRQTWYMSSSQRAFGPDGTMYGLDYGAALLVNFEHDNFGITEYNPGVGSSGVLVFDIPKTASLTHLELHASPGTVGAKVTIN
ncbi:DUF4352 domain-containing protein [Longispora sp. NPDC051575]|uniref:DUF4352 domain-containing protein n=1 Tax=Longispora sp. NPDC051575 TaxID=3154943 RepID=UPI00343E2526